VAYRRNTYAIIYLKRILRNTSFINASGVSLMDDFSLHVKPLSHLLIAPGEVDCKFALI
jgi:hypothetical protein